MAVWGIYRWEHFSLTWDYGIYAQAAHLIARGDWAPYSSIREISFLQNHGELLMWPLAILVWLSGSTRILLVVQAAAVALASAAALHWTRQIVRGSSLTATRGRQVTALIAILILFNPWLYWAVSFDVHMEPIVLPAVIMAAMALWQRRYGKAFLWAGVTILGGDVPSSYLVGVGVSGLFMGPAVRRPALSIAILGGVALLGFEHLVPGGIVGSDLAGLYPELLRGVRSPTFLSVVIGALTHPEIAADTLRSNLANLYATVAPEGLLGLVVWPAMGVPYLVLGENGLIPSGVWTTPTLFQSIPVIPFVIVGTAMAATALLARWDLHPVGRLAGTTLLGLIFINGAAWAAGAIPPIPNRWADISSGKAQVLTDILHRIPKGAEVFAANEFAGRFAIRPWIYVEGHLTGGRLPLHGTPVYFVLAPAGPMEMGTVAWNWTVADAVAAIPGVRAIVRRDGVCAYEWAPPRGDRFLSLPTRRKKGSIAVCLP